MGLSYEEMLSCTFREFDYLQRGHNRRVERGWDYVRHLVAASYNSSGFQKKAIKPKEIMQLPMLDGIGKPVKAEKMDKADVNRLLDVLKK
jgi:hypothetical protein